MNHAPTIMTRSGTTINLLDPDPDTLHIEDIAHGLSNCCRYVGQVDKFYSVAQHCVLASFIVSPEYARETLTHDGSEAYLGDVSSPLKQLLPEYKAIEHRFEMSIAKKFVLDISKPALSAVKHVDQMMLSTESRDLFVVDRPILSEYPRPHPARIRPWSARVARKAFLLRAVELGLLEYPSRKGIFFNIKRRLFWFLHLSSHQHRLLLQEWPQQYCEASRT